MKIALRILLLFLVLLASCEKIGDEQYTLKFYGDAYEDVGYSVSILKDGYVIGGQVTEIKREAGRIVSSSKKMGIIKTGWDGNIRWKISAGGKYDDWGSKIYQVDDGSVICVGTSTDTTAAGLSTDIFVVKVTPEGKIEWQRSYGGEGNQTGTDVVKTSAGYVVLGTTDVKRRPLSDSTGNVEGNTDILLLKIKDNGDFIESFANGYPGNDIGKVLNWNPDGSFMVFGTTDRSDPGQDNNNLLLMRINSAGYVTNAKIIGDKRDEYAGDMEVLTEGYLLTYNILLNDGSQEIWVTKLNNDIHSTPVFSGKKLTIINPDSGDNSACAYALSRFGTGSFLIAGQSGKGSSAKLLVFEIDAEGNPVTGHQMIKGSTGVQAAYDVASGDDEYIIAVGKNSYDVNSMITFLKFKF